MITQARLYVIGDVIGVGFRAWTKIQTKSHNVTGWVRNEHRRAEVFGMAGGVEVLLQGQDHDVERMIQTIRKGPPISRVEEVEVMHEKPREIFDSFEIRK
jgi:acylphosphatase